MSRNISMMSLPLQWMYSDWSAAMKRAGIPFMRTSVDRMITEQMALYVQGRLSLQDINRFRLAAGMYPLPANENRIVTWTLQSLHVVNPLDTDEGNDKAWAFDFAILKDNKPTWDLKVSVNDNEIPDYLEAARLWKALGGTAGAFWNKPDYPHLQIERRDP